jgi:hypothetical protein
MPAESEKCHGPLDAANGREILGGAAALLEMFRKPE